MHIDHSERGSVLLVALAAGMLIAGMSYAYISTVVVEAQAQRGRSDRTTAILIAEAAAADMKVNLLSDLDEPTATLGSADSPIEFGGGAYWADAVQENSGSYVVVSYARYGSAAVTLETRWGREFHALRDYSIYSGNQSGVDGNDFSLGGTGSLRDEIRGKIYVDGNLELTGDSEMHGDAVATGSIMGNEIDGETRENAPRIDAPDLKAMNYEQIADFKIDDSSPWDGNGEIAENDPRHIFVKEFRDDLAGGRFTFDNTNYFFGDPHEGSNITKVSVSADGNRKVYFIDGNLWIEPQGVTSQLIDSPADGTQITIVARGNIYFADNLLYDNEDKDALLFIALTDKESYKDLDGDNQYDPGEPILHDDGDGVYEGPIEGSGNIFFGDPNGGPLGHVHAFMYADNFFEDHVLDGPGGKGLPFEITGFMSAGEQVQIQRDYTYTTGRGRRRRTVSAHAKMEVNFDDRIVNGELTLPGFPEKSSTGELGQLSWRLMQAPE